MSAIHEIDELTYLNGVERGLCVEGDKTFLTHHLSGKTVPTMIRCGLLTLDA